MLRIENIVSGVKAAVGGLPKWLVRILYKFIHFPP
jgi:hypothetical protein